MNRRLLALTCGALTLFLSVSHAQNNFKNCVDLTDVDHTTAGFRCLTTVGSKSIVWERVTGGWGESWKDTNPELDSKKDPQTGEEMATGWGDKLPGNESGNYHNFDLDPVNFPPTKKGVIVKSEATEACKLVAGHLPTYAEYMQAVDDGLFQVIPNTFNYYWLSSLETDKDGITSAFLWTHGSLLRANRDNFSDHFDKNAVRCVNR
jgi:hypothetical protein